MLYTQRVGEAGSAKSYTIVDQMIEHMKTKGTGILVITPTTRSRHRHAQNGIP